MRGQGRFWRERAIEVHLAYMAGHVTWDELLERLRFYWRLIEMVKRAARTV